MDEKLVCCACGGDNVELKVWWNVKTGAIDESGAQDNDDTYCNDCEDHLGVEYVKKES